MTSPPLPLRFVQSATSVDQLPPTRGEPSRTVTSASGSSVVSRWAAASPETPPPTTAMRTGSGRAGTAPAWHRPGRAGPGEPRAGVLRHSPMTKLRRPLTGILLAIPTVLLIGACGIGLGDDSGDDAASSSEPAPARAQQALKLTAAEATEGTPAEELALKNILGSLTKLAQGVTELRNKVGVGHGRESVPTWVRPRHARLAAGAAQVWCQLVLETLEDPTAPWRNGASTRPG